MKKIKLLLILAVIVGFTSCEALEGLFEDTTKGLSQEEVVKGLRTALIVGADTSVAELNSTDGYFANALLKIFLPDEA